LARGGVPSGGHFSRKREVPKFSVRHLPPSPSPLPSPPLIPPNPPQSILLPYNTYPGSPSYSVHPYSPPSPTNQPSNNSLMTTSTPSRLATLRPHPLSVLHPALTILFRPVALRTYLDPWLLLPGGLGGRPRGKGQCQGGAGRVSAGEGAL